MANLKHLKILKQGREVWNKWRKYNPDIKPDLSHAALENFNLSGVFLKNADFHESIFINVDFTDAKMSFSDLSGSSFFKSKFHKTKLKYSNLSKINLNATNFIRTNLYRSNLSKSNLTFCNFQSSHLIEANLKNSNITGANFYGTSREDWMINGITCDYVFWDEAGKKRTPIDRIFRSDEFEALYNSLPTIEYYFKNGLTPLDTLLMDLVVQAVNKQHPEFELKLDSFHSRGRPHARFTVIHKDNTDKALEEIKQKYEQEIKYLEGQRDYANQMMLQLMSKLKQTQIQHGDTITIQAEGGVVFAKDQAKSTLVRESQAGIIGDTASVSSGIHISEEN